MLYPQSNSQRQMIDLSGFWRIQFDPDDSANLGAGFEGGEIIAVPASWNDQFNERRDYVESLFSDSLKYIRIEIKDLL
jgi:hypothetical protein